LAALRIDADGNAAGVRLAGFPHQRRIAYCHRTEDHARDTLREPGFDRRHVANATTELSRDVDAREDALHRSRIRRLPREGTIEIDDMQIAEALLLERARLRAGVVVEDGRRAHLAVLEADALAVLEVDRREQDH